jgi:hypothetical protein
MKALTCCEPRQSVLYGWENFVVNLSPFTELSEAEAAEFLDANVLTSGMERGKGNLRVSQRGLGEHGRGAELQGGGEGVSKGVVI